MSDILKNKALKAVQGAMANNPIGGSDKVKWAMHVKDWENDDKDIRTKPTATEQPDTPKRNKKKSKTHTAQSRRVS